MIEHTPMPSQLHTPHTHTRCHTLMITNYCTHTLIHTHAHTLSCMYTHTIAHTLLHSHDYPHIHTHTSMLAHTQAKKTSISPWCRRACVCCPVLSLEYTCTKHSAHSGTADMTPSRTTSAICTRTHTVIHTHMPLVHARSCTHKQSQKTIHSHTCIHAHTAYMRTHAHKHTHRMHTRIRT